MTPFDSQSFNRLAKEISGANETFTKHLCSGSALDFADYQHRSGYIRALNDVCEWMTKVERDLRQGK